MFYQYSVFTKNTPMICLILHQFNLYVLLTSLAFIWSLRNGSFSTIFKIQAEIAILSRILTPEKVKKVDFNRHQFFFHK